MRNIFLFLIVVSSVFGGPISPLEIGSTEEGEDVDIISRLRDTSIPSSVSGNIDAQSSEHETEDSSASIALAAALFEQIEHETAPESPPEAVPVSESSTFPLGTNKLPVRRPKNKVYAELPVGTTPDPNTPDIGPDGKEIPLRPWGEYGKRIPPLLITTTSATTPSIASSEKKVVPGTIDVGGDESEAKNVGAAGDHFVDGSTRTTASDLGETNVQNGPIQSPGCSRHREPQQECVYEQSGISPCGFSDYAQNQYPVSGGGDGGSDFPIQAPYAHQIHYNPK